jgi:predicted nucleotidyltransferase
MSNVENDVAKEVSDEREHDADIRGCLLAGVRRFVEAACRRPEVRRIALVGSLTTNKSTPKDVDVLVTVDPSAELVGPARLGRTLNGHAQQRNRGADICLAEPPDCYIGRTCQWRECAAGIRAACEAQHCARRPHLNDDLHVVTLTAALVQSPPIELWPQAVRRVPVPAHVEELLLNRLNSGATE